MNPAWVDYVKRVEAIARVGLTNCRNPYDLERYEELRRLSIELLHAYTGEDLERIETLFASDPGYKTPKTEVRGVVFKERGVLLVRELADGKWSLPGGYCEVGYSPAENVVREIGEESGYKVRPQRVLAILDRSKHPHPPSPYHVYKIFIRCEIVGGVPKRGLETDDARFFERSRLPELSENRILPEQLDRIFDFLDKPDGPVLFD